MPTPPQAWVDTTMPPVTGQSINVPAGGDLQGAINSAHLGDEIILQAGATYGAITLPNKSGSGWLIIRSSLASQMPLGTRVSPGDAPHMARIVGGAGSSAAVQTDNGAHHYRFVGIEFTVSPGAYSTGLVRLGSGYETTLGQLPHDLIIDRCYIHGDPSAGGRRGIALNSGAAAVIDSHISDWKGVGDDTQAIAGWNGSGPYKIVNNYLEGAAENILVGGSDPLIHNLTPSDIEIRRNHFFKPLAWRSQSWQVKNLFELKNAQRVLIDGNVFENNWAAAQNGTSVLFSVRDQDGTAPWTVVQDVTFTNNTVKHVASGLKVTGFDDTGFPCQQTRRVLIRNNVFDDVNDSTWGGDGRMFLLLYGPDSVIVDHNTGFPTGAYIIADDSRPFTNFVSANNITMHGNFGVKGDGNGEGIGTLTNLFPGYVYARTAMIGGSSSLYPPDNFFPASVTNVSFVNYSGGNYRITPGTPYASAATDGTALGADIDALEAAQRGGGGGGSTPLTVSFTAPGSGATVSGTTTVSLAASGGSGSGYSYTLTIDGTSVPMSGSSYSWNTSAVSNGTHTLAGTARDSAGHTATASESVTVQNNGHPAPTVSFTNPASSATVSGTVTVSMSATGGSGTGYSYTVRAGSATIYSGGNNSFSWNSGSTPNGPVTLTATVTDSAGATGTASRNVTVANGGGGGSTVSITSPASGVWTGNSIELSAAATGSGALARIELWGAGSAFATLPCSGTTCSGSTWWLTGPLHAGAYVVNAVAVSQAGTRTTSAPITIYKDATSPTYPSGAGTGGGGTGALAVDITSPPNNAWTGNSIDVAARATDNVALRTIQIYGDGSRVGTINCTSSTCSGTVLWLTGPLAAGRHTITAVATDSSGNSKTSSPVTINK